MIHIPLLVRKSFRPPILEFRSWSNHCLSHRELPSVRPSINSYHHQLLPRVVTCLWGQLLGDTDREQKTARVMGNSPVFLVGRAQRKTNIPSSSSAEPDLSSNLLFVPPAVKSKQKRSRNSSGNVKLLLQRREYSQSCANLANSASPICVLTDNDDALSTTVLLYRSDCGSSQSLSESLTSRPLDWTPRLACWLVTSWALSCSLQISVSACLSVCLSITWSREYCCKVLRYTSDDDSRRIFSHTRKCTHLYARK